MIELLLLAVVLFGIYLIAVGFAILLGGLLGTIDRIRGKQPDPEARYPDHWVIKKELRGKKVNGEEL